MKKKSCTQCNEIACRVEADLKEEGNGKGLFIIFNENYLEEPYYKNFYCDSGAS